MAEQASTQTEVHVFAFEGRGGFPPWAVPGAATAPRRQVDTAGDPVLERGRLSLSQVLNYWFDAVRAAGPCGWHYYAQNQWRPAVAEIRTLLADDNSPPEPPQARKAIVLLGFSNGGDAVYQVARALEKLPVAVDLVVTADPVRKPLRGIGLAGFRKPGNVGLWHNLYQRCDRRTLGGFCPVVGHGVNGADSERRLVAEDFTGGLDPAVAHLWIPAHPLVLETITDNLRRLAPIFDGGKRG